MTAASLRGVPPLSYLHLRSNPQPVSVMLLKSPRSYWTLMNIGSLTRYLSRVPRSPNLGGESVCTLSSVSLASQVALVVKNLPANAGDMRDTGSIPGLGRSPGGGHSNPPTAVFLPGKSHGQSSLVGCSP